eukprot:354682-Chlamydomonas_euryale.AAC.3
MRTAPHSSSQLAAMMLRPGGLSQQSISTLRHTMRAFERTSAELQVRVFLGGSKKASYSEAGVWLDTPVAQYAAPGHVLTVNDERRYEAHIGWIDEWMDNCMGEVEGMVKKTGRGSWYAIVFVANVRSFLGAAGSCSSAEACHRPVPELKRRCDGTRMPVTVTLSSPKAVFSVLAGLGLCVVVDLPVLPPGSQHPSSLRVKTAPPVAHSILRLCALKQPPLTQLAPLTPVTPLVRWPSPLPLSPAGSMHRTKSRVLTASGQTGGCTSPWCRWRAGGHHAGDKLWPRGGVAGDVAGWEINHGKWGGGGVQMIGSIVARGGGRGGRGRPATKHVKWDGSGVEASGSTLARDGGRGRPATAIGGWWCAGQRIDCGKGRGGVAAWQAAK